MFGCAGIELAGVATVLICCGGQGLLVCICERTQFVVSLLAIGS